MTEPIELGIADEHEYSDFTVCDSPVASDGAFLATWRQVRCPVYPDYCDWNFDYQVIDGGGAPVGEPFEEIRNVEGEAVGVVDGFVLVRSGLLPPAEPDPLHTPLVLSLISRGGEVVAQRPHALPLRSRFRVAAFEDRFALLSWGEPADRPTIQVFDVGLEPVGGPMTLVLDDRLPTAFYPDLFLAGVPTGWVVGWSMTWHVAGEYEHDALLQQLDAAGRPVAPPIDLGPVSSGYGIVAMASQGRDLYAAFLLAPAGGHRTSVLQRYSCED